MRAKSCKTEGCDNLAENPEIGLCATHAREARKKAKLSEPKAKTRIKPVSDKQADRNEVYMGIRNMFLKFNPRCCVHLHCRATQVHHAKGRIGDLLYDVRYFKGVCDAGHHWIELHPEEAKELGFSDFRLATEPTE
jgi:hypothetical protein